MGNAAEKSVRLQHTPHKPKPKPPNGLPGLFLYGALTILGALALVVTAE